MVTLEFSVLLLNAYLHRPKKLCITTVYAADEGSSMEKTQYADIYIFEDLKTLKSSNSLKTFIPADSLDVCAAT